jgi:alkanesulfonate monooxygenase SsuD/methylene tetrahydromethanopterin reductase-like flavin-dependent oxidoreductase (luciferase family)
MKVGLVLPVFERSPAKALAVARDAEGAGIDGVFSYDHLFPLNRPDRPSLPALGILPAVAMHTDRIRVGSLIIRVTTLPAPVLVRALVTLNEIAEGRVIAGLGTGDSLTRPEVEAYGLEFPPVGERLARLRHVARELRTRGVPVWIGGRSTAVREVARDEADAWNTWDGPLSELAVFSGPVTWAGPPPRDIDLAGHVKLLAAAGAAWAVYGPAPSIDWPAFVRELAGAAEGVQ